MRSVMVMLAAAIASPLRADEPAPVTPKELEARVDALNAEITKLAQQRKPAEALPNLRELVAVRQKQYPPSEHPKGHATIAGALTQLGAAQQTLGQAKAARTSLEQALAMWQALHPDPKGEGHPDYARTLHQMAMYEEQFGAPEAAIRHAEAALAMRLRLFPESKFPDGHPLIVASFFQLINLLNNHGYHVRADPYTEQCYNMCRRLYPRDKFPDGHLQLAGSLANLAVLLWRRGDLDRAVSLLEECLAIYQRQYPRQRFPNGQRDMMAAYRVLGEMHYTMGAYEKGLANAERSLAMARKLFPSATNPRGHPAIALGLNCMGLSLTELGPQEKAVEVYEQALAMYRELFPEARFPNGVAMIPQILGNLGCVSWKKEEYAKAQEYYRQAVKAARKLFPEDTHPNGNEMLARLIHDFGVTHQVQGQYEEARPLYEEALAISRRLYPDARFPNGHPRLIKNLTDVGGLWGTLGKPDKALPYFEEAFTLDQRWLDHQIATASEEDAISYVRRNPELPRFYLSASRLVSGTETRAYGYVWDMKAKVARVLERRHVVARAAKTENAAKIARLRTLRLRTEALLQDTALKPAERDRQLADLADERSALERELTAALPELALRPTQRLGPADLCHALPANSAFIDVLGYERYEQDPDRKGRAGETWAPSYAAFILLPGRGTVGRVELGDAKPINDAIAEWRAAIESQRGDAAAVRLRALVWDKLAPHLPRGTETLYLSLDRELTRVPWCALPGARPGTVLLEEFSGGIAVVPYGPFLLQALKSPRPFDRAGEFLAVGRVDYGSSGWPALAGTERELAALAALPIARRAALTKGDALPKRLTDALPRAGCAHLATHGFFSEKDLLAERRRADEARGTWQLGGSVPRAVAARNPLGFTGLVLAQGEVLTGLALVDLPLENLRLVTLSACETGLGDFADGQGVQGLQQAFHLAGCPNVVASLWKVNDAATAALMAQFYHELWVNKREPLAALREAQLTIYRHPERIKALAGERGRPALDSAAKLGSAATEKMARTTPTKLWAAFVLSGVGK